MIRKLRVVFDLDNTTFMTSKAFIDTYKTIHQKEIESGLIPFPIWEGVVDYNFKDELPLLTRQELLEIFDSEAFFDNISLVRDSNLFSMGDLITQMCKSNKYEIFICTVGSATNLALKEKYISRKFPDFDMNNFIGINSAECKMDKSILKDYNVDILIDDHQDNLTTSGVPHPILFCINGVKTNWNEDLYDNPKYNRCNSVSELTDKILDIYYFGRAIG